MRKISTRDLRDLEVINTCSGEKLGYPTDFELDIDCGQILSLIVPQCEGVPFFGKRQDYIIPWNKIDCIGEDTILVRINMGETFCCDYKKKKKKI